MDNESNQSQNNTGLLVKIMNNVLGLILISLSHTSLSRSSNFSDYSEGLALARVSKHCRSGQESPHELPTRFPFE